MATRTKLNFDATFRQWLATRWPTLVDTQMAVPDYIVGLVQSGYAPATVPVEPWAALAARGYFELQWTTNRGMSSQPPGSLLDALASMNRGPVNQFSSQVVQARGPKDTNCKSAVAFAAIYWPDYFKAFIRTFRYTDWAKRVNALVT